VAHHRCCRRRPAHDYSHLPANCNQAATIAVTILAGPLNYLGVNPQISCRHLPQPSK
jgi:hypothetical protein